MIVGSGLLAQAFADEFAWRDDVCIYAAGVSNSACKNEGEFVREQERLSKALREASHADPFVYFGTCSVADPESRHTPYVQHKLAMERLVQGHPRGLILRLPQVAGSTPNPHTLLNFLYARISRSERFDLWINAKRNIIDVADVVLIAKQLMADRSVRNAAINVANTVSYAMQDIVRAMERVTGKEALFNVLDRGSGYHVDTRDISPILKRLNIEFDDGYLDRVIDKYYGTGI